LFLKSRKYCLWK